VPFHLIVKGTDFRQAIWNSRLSSLPENIFLFLMNNNFFFSSNPSSFFVDFCCIPLCFMTLLPELFCFFALRHFSHFSSFVVRIWSGIMSLSVVTKLYGDSKGICETFCCIFLFSPIFVFNNLHLFVSLVNHPLSYY